MIRVVAVAVVGLFLSGCLRDPDGSDDATPTHSPTLPITQITEWGFVGKSCGELALLVPVPVTNLRPHMPTRYQPVEANGQATLVLSVLKCARVDVEGDQTAVEGDAGVFIEDPTGAPSPAVYLFAKASNRDSFVTNFTALGVNIGYAPEMSLLTFGLASAAIAQAHVPLPDGGYDIDITGGPVPIPPPQPLASPWYHDSGNGTSRIDYSLALKTEGPGQGRVVAKPGSLVSKLLGTTDVVEAPGVYWTHDATVSATRLDP